MMHQLIHVFVYGTLRPGNPNHGLISEAVASAVDAVVEGLQLLVPSHGAFPYACPLEGSRTRGTLLAIRPEQWPTARRRLDRLEGYDESSDTGHYLRRQLQVRTDRGDVAAWVYLAGPRTPVQTMSPVPGNEWPTPTPTRARQHRLTH